MSAPTDKPPMLPLEFDMRDPADVAVHMRAFHETMTRRRTVRDFSDRAVPSEFIADAVRIAASAPSGANQQPWHFCCIGDMETKRKIRAAAEAEEAQFYAGRAGEEWLDALKPLGTDAQKPFLETAPWLIAVFAQRHGLDASGAPLKHYYINESVGIACGFLIAALHQAGLATLTHTPAPMGFLRDICRRPAHEKPVILLVTGYPADDAEVPAITRKGDDEVTSWFVAP